MQRRGEAERVADEKNRPTPECRASALRRASIPCAARRRHQNLVLGEEAGEGRDAGDGERRGPHQRPRDGHVLLQAAHVAHVLRVLVVARVVIRRVHGVDHGARAEEQQRLEERVRHQVKDAGDVRAGAHAHEHVAELGHGGIREHLLDVPLLEADRRREESP